MLEYLRLWKSEVDLDAAWVREQEFEWDTAADDPDVDETRPVKLEPQVFLAFLAPYVRFALESGATGYHVMWDRQDESMRVLIRVLDAEGSGRPGWTELVPPAPCVHRAITRGIRALAGMLPGAKRGVFRYVYQGTRRRAACVQDTPDDLVIYFTDDRPPLRRR
ncbi:MAG TPA: hypothetical protein PKK06_01745 [Phycisphaerae bacterium]|nr:hypothetical protein [Phycisphaerae bacterium]HNU44153.1 hypothetical protein [Phycisphaerae bacterium]